MNHSAEWFSAKGVTRQGRFSARSRTTAAASPAGMAGSRPPGLQPGTRTARIWVLRCGQAHVTTDFLILNTLKPFTSRISQVHSLQLQHSSEGMIFFSGGVSSVTTMSPKHESGDVNATRRTPARRAGVTNRESVAVRGPWSAPATSADTKSNVRAVRTRRAS